MSTNHLKGDGQRDHKRNIRLLRNFDAVTIVEQRDILANLRQEVAAFTVDAKIPVQEIALDMDGLAIFQLDLKALARKMEKVLMQADSVCTLVIDLIVGRQSNHLLLDMRDLLTRS